MKKKIAHITTVHYRHDVRIMYKYCRSLVDEDFDVSLVVSDGYGDEILHKVNIIDLGKSKFGRLGRFFLGSLNVFIHLIRKKYELLHFHDPELIPLALFMRILGCKVVFDMHENLPLQILTKTYLPKPIRYTLYQISYLFQRFAFMFLPVIFAEISYKRYFKNIKRQKIVLNYPLKETLENISLPKKENFTLGYMGWLNKERGTIATLEVVSKIRATVKLDLLFVGPYGKDINENILYKESIEEEWATFLGRLEPKKGWQEMSKCHVGLAVLENSPNFVESYPTKIFEYMLLGLPIIVSNFPLYKKIIDESQCGISVDPSSLEDFENAILWLINNPDKSKIMGQNGKKIAQEKYNWESEFLKVKFFYYDLLHSKL